MTNQFSLTLSLQEILIRILMAIIIGGMIGYERGHSNRPAGFRTHILVCLGAAIVSLTQDQLRINLLNLAETNHNAAQLLKTDLGRIGAQVVSGIGFLGAGTIMRDDQLRINLLNLAETNHNAAQLLKTDLGRIGAQVVSGIGFLGAGTIMRDKGVIGGLTTAASIWATGCIGLKTDLGRIGAQVVSGIGFLGAGTIMRDKGVIGGLTTAASIWATGCIGLGIGWGFYYLAVPSGVAILIVLVTLKKVERSLIDNRHIVKIAVQFSQGTQYNDNLLETYEILKKMNITIKSLKRGSDDNKIVYVLVTAKEMDTFEIMSELSKCENVSQVQIP